MKEIPIYGGLVALVDDEDYEDLAQYKWYESRRPGKSSYVIRTKKISGRTRTYYMHKMIVDYARVDHINGNGLDNRKENLRSSTNQQNSRNQTRVKLGSSRYKGVHLASHKVNNRWQAQITVDGKARYIGYYATEEDAARAYDSKAVELFGEFAALNFPSQQKER